MVITCASCLTKFNLDDSRITSKGVKVRCSRCKHVFYVVSPPETKEEVMENFESFAKYHKDLMVPGEVPAKEPVQEKVSPPPPRQEEERPQKPKPVEEAPSEKEEEEALLFRDRATKEIEKEEVSYEGGEKVEAKSPSSKEKARRRERRGPSPFLAILIILLLLVFGLFYLWTEVGSGGKLSPYLEAPIKRIETLWQKVWGTEREGLQVGDLTGYEEKIGDTSIFVIEGKVNNQSRFNRKHIKVKVILFDQDKVKMAEKEAICGLTLSRQDLKSQPPAFFKGEMVVKPQTEKEGIVSAGKICPFMVIFRDPLSQAREFKVEIVEAPNL